MEANDFSDHSKRERASTKTENYEDDEDSILSRKATFINAAKDSPSAMKTISPPSDAKIGVGTYKESSLRDHYMVTAGGNDILLHQGRGVALKVRNDLKKVDDKKIKIKDFALPFSPGVPGLISPYPRSTKRTRN